MIELDLEGGSEFEMRLRELENDLDATVPWVVGTAVNYAIYLEFGTSKMDPKPFFTPVLIEVKQQGVEGFIRRNAGRNVESMDDIDDVIAALALSIESRVKKLITEKGLIQTGRLRASITAVPGDNPDLLPTEDDIDVPDEGVPEPYGEFVRREVEI